MDTLNVLYSTDSNYAPHCAASVYSLLYHNKDFGEINIHIIDDSISDECKDKFRKTVLEFSNAKLSFYPFEALKEELKLNDKSGFAPVGYARLMLSKITDAEKMLYLDCDTIVNSSVRDLWDIDISDVCVAGVQDNPALFMSEVIGMTADDRYINSGVMLINLNKWRNEKIEEKIIKMIQDYNGFVPHHDQGIINGVCKNSIKIIHPKFNTMPQFFYFKARQIKSLYDMNEYYSQQELDEAVKAPIVVHYISKFYNRPWFKSCTHPMKDLYTHFLEKTAFDVVLQEGNLKKQARIRKFILDHFPFFIYAGFERILDIKRKRAHKK